MRKLLSIGILSCLLLVSNKLEAQIVIAPQPYISSAGVAISSIKLPSAATFSWSSSVDGSGVSDIFFRRSAAKTLTLDTDGAAGNLTLINLDSVAIVASGTFSSTGNQSASGFTATNGAQGFYVTSRAGFGSTADSLTQVTNFAGTTGLELNGGVPTLGACTGGAVTSGSHNSAGEVTGNTSGSCVLNFGTPNFTNAPFCILNDETSLVAARVSARSSSSITITGLTSGDAVQYICLGRIGT